LAALFNLKGKAMKTTVSKTLYFKQGTSDKIYKVWIDEDADGARVQFAYGRRGSTLTTGTKTQSPVTSEGAMKIFNKLVAEKEAKGYTEGESGAAYLGTSNEQRKTGLAPQLLNAIDESAGAGLLADPLYGAQEKLDGKRIIIVAFPSSVIASNRKGLECGIPENVSNAAMALAAEISSFTIDGEMVGETFIAFDMLQRGATDIRSRPYRQRYDVLKVYIGEGSTAIQYAELAETIGDKARLFTRLKAEGKEGIVFKRLDAPYTAGRPNSGGTQFKWKFVDTCSALVGHINKQRSVSLSLFDEAKKLWVGVGNVTIPPNREVPPVGSIVEIRYLYAYKGGSLYQPIYLGQRDDIERINCTLSQLKYKAEAAA
jgi:bifunctional non-homologous end joining protein LigD